MSHPMIHFPWLHPQLASGPLPTELSFFDPGMPLTTDQPRFRPDDLPCTPAEVRRILASYMEFASRFPRASDMQAYQALGLENFYTDTSMDIRSQLTSGAHTDPAEQLANERRQAQLVLALALFREEQFIGIHEQKADFEHAQENFAQALGLDNEEPFAETGASGAALFSRASVELPWKSVMGPLLHFLPPDTALFISDTEVLRELQALDIHFDIQTADNAMMCAHLDQDTLRRICGAHATRSVTILARRENI